MAVVVRAASFDDELDLDLAGLGVGMIGVGARYAERDDARLIERTGFVFDAFEADALYRAARRALAVYRRPQEWQRLQQRAMQQSCDWSGPARQYLLLYERVCS